MTESTPREKILWVIGTVVVLLYALTPVAWIISLSLKAPETIGDGKFFPTEVTTKNYSAVFARAWVSAMPCSTRSASR